MLESAQVRVHSSTATDLYLSVQSHPIVEDCSAMLFAPHPAVGVPESGGKWGDVHDFGWLRAGPSPNW